MILNRLYSVIQEEDCPLSEAICISLEFQKKNMFSIIKFLDLENNCLLLIDIIESDYDYTVYVCLRDLKITVSTEKTLI